MGFWSIMLIDVAPTLATFYLVARVWGVKRRQGNLSSNWDETGVFVFAVLMGLIWPLTLLWLVGRRPTSEERKAAALRKAAEVAARNLAAEARLGLGQGDDYTNHE